ncbi:MAG: ABC transporter permease [SAR324 cluster bacterium]|nr:ABC transporter permease [SAR324 cluster bacterium]
MKPLDLILQRIERLGRTTLESVSGVGTFGILFGQALALVMRRPFRVQLFFKQMEFIGNKSLGVVILTGMFTGMVLTFQTYRSLRDFGSESIVGGLVAVAMVRELGPVLTALMVNARAGSAIAAELGTMRVTEQIDALFALAVNPVQYLVTPRVLAGFIMVPMLTAVSDMTGIVGGYLVGVILLGVDPGIYFAKVIDFVSLSDIVQGTVKAATFGTILAQVAAYKGYYTSGGAEGVGRATTEAVVVSAVLILFSDYLITVFWQS